VGGTNDPTNLVLLTAREHFICHRLLCLMYPKSNGLRFAFWAMCNQLHGDVARNYKISSRTYELAKLGFKEANSELHSGKKLSNEHLTIVRSRMLSDANPMKGRKGIDNPLYNKPRSAEIKSKISNTKLNNPENNASYKGYYITPLGYFKSARQASLIHKLSADVIRSRCKSNSNTIITKRHLANSIGLDDSMIGYTFKQLGWDFISQPRK
jgi:hypothetical protein